VFIVHLTAAEAISAHELCRQGVACHFVDAQFREMVRGGPCAGIEWNKTPRQEMLMRVALVSMPFYNPSFAPYNLLKLKAYCDERNPGRHSIDVISLNHDFVAFFGLKNYLQISATTVASGLGEWLFRPIAHPGQAEDLDGYRALFARVIGPGSEDIFREAEEKRPLIQDFLEETMRRHGLLDRYDVVGFTTIFAQNNAAFGACRILKRANPSIVTCLGGPHCASPMGEEILRNIDAVDLVFSGTALLSFGEYLSAINDPEAVRAIPGAVHRTNLSNPHHPRYDNRVTECVEVKMDHRAFLSEFSRLFPNGELQPMIMFATSSGCSWGEKSRCAFCGLNAEREKYQTLPPAAMGRALEECLQYYPVVKEFHAVDNLIPPEVLNLEVEGLKERPDVVFRYETRSTLSRDELVRLAERNIRWIQPGIESLSTRELQLMRKGVSAFQNIIFLKNCLALDIFPSWNVLVGIPGMTPGDYGFYYDLLPKLFHLIPPLGAFPTRCDRFSPLFDEFKQAGRQVNPLPYYASCYPFPPESLANFAYHFAFPHMVEILPTLGRLRGLCAQWRQVWKQAVPPQLVRQSTMGGEFVFDSRMGSPQRYKLTSQVVEILTLLERSQSRESILKQLPALAPHDLDSALTSLVRTGLVIREGDFYLSIVMGREPPSIAFIRRNI
jgi:ribosomal peptide maturation radical SAM protein 1